MRPRHHTRRCIRCEDAQRKRIPLRQNNRRDQLARWLMVPAAGIEPVVHHRTFYEAKRSSKQAAFVLRFTQLQRTSFTRRLTPANTRFRTPYALDYQFIDLQSLDLPIAHGQPTYGNIAYRQCSHSQRPYRHRHNHCRENFGGE